MRLAWTAGIALATSLAAAPPGPVPGERVEVRLVRVPLTLEERKPGGCESIGPESIEILEDGVAASTRYLDANPLPTVHAVLVDAGPGMLDSLGQVREAATAYIDSIPAGDPALLAIFDHRLLLAAGLSRDRKRFRDGVQWLEPGAGSHLWSSVSQVTRLLQPRRERKALILITRGCDTDPQSRVDAAQALEEVLMTEGLSVFVVGVDVPERCPSSGEAPQEALQALAERSGGVAYFLDRRGQRLRGAFRGVQARLVDEQAAVYVPLPFGEGAKDDPEKERRRWRRLRARLTHRAACRVALAGAAVRCEPAADHPERCEPDPEEARLLTPVTLDLERRIVSGRVEDPVADAGPVAPELDLLGRPATSGRSEQVKIARDLELPLLRLDEIVDRGARSTDPILAALARTPDVPGRDWRQTPFLVNGTTLLELRASLARVLYRAPEFSSWLRRRTARDRLEEFDAVMRGGGASLFDEDTRNLARETLAGGDFEPDDDEILRGLGAWLGDVSVATVHRAVEAWLARNLVALTARNGPEGLEAGMPEALRSWQRLRDWIPEEGAVRSIGWLLPGYDPAQDAVGFYRIVLSTPYSVEIRNSLMALDPETSVGMTADSWTPGISLYQYMYRFNYSPGEPLGVYLTAWLLEHPVVARRLVDFTLVDVEYPHGNAQELGPVLKERGIYAYAPHLAEQQVPSRLVNLVLTPPGDPSRRFRVGAYFSPHGEPEAEFGTRPICIVLPATDRLLDEERDLLGSIVATELASPVPCLGR